MPRDRPSLCRFRPLHRTPFPTALVREQRGPRGTEELLGRHIERRAFHNRIPDVDPEAAIIPALGFHFARRFAHAAEHAPSLFRFEAPVRAPVEAVRTI